MKCVAIAMEKSIGEFGGEEVHSNSNSKMSTLNVVHWTESDVIMWLKQIDEIVSLSFIREERLDGKSLLALTEDDIRDLKTKYHSLRLGDWKHFWIAIRGLQKENYANLVNLGLMEMSTSGGAYSSHTHQLNSSHHHHHHHNHHHCSCCSDISGVHDMERISPPLSIDGCATSIPPEIFKTMISLGECSSVAHRATNQLFILSNDSAMWRHRRSESSALLLHWCMYDVRCAFPLRYVCVSVCVCIVVCEIIGWNRKECERT